MTIKGFFFRKKKKNRINFLYVGGRDEPHVHTLRYVDDLNIQGLETLLKQITKVRNIKVECNPVIRIYIHYRRIEMERSKKASSIQ